jgi:hypothetical protein
MSLGYAVRDSSPACPRSWTSKRCHGKLLCVGGLCCKQLFHALATAPPYFATEVESNSLRSREVTLGTSRYQIPRSGLGQRASWVAGPMPNTPTPPPRCQAVVLRCLNRIAFAPRVSVHWIAPRQSAFTPHVSVTFRSHQCYRNQSLDLAWFNHPQASDFQVADGRSASNGDCDKNRSPASRWLGIRL